MYLSCTCINTADMNIDTIIIMTFHTICKVELCTHAVMVTHYPSSSYACYKSICVLFIDLIVCKLRSLNLAYVAFSSIKVILYTYLFWSICTVSISWINPLLSFFSSRNDLPQSTFKYQLLGLNLLCLLSQNRLAEFHTVSSEPFMIIIIFMGYLWVNYQWPDLHSRLDSWPMFKKYGQFYCRPNYPAYSKNDVWPKNLLKHTKTRVCEVPLTWRALC